MDNILFVDTETTGIPLDPLASFKNIDNWPNILQIAWIVYKKDGTLVSSHNFAISNDVGSIVAPTSEYVPKIILPIHQILDCFLDSLSQCDVVVGHNIEYDVQVILCELYRYGKDTDRLNSIQQFCTMKNSVDICGFDTTCGERYPKLQELYSKLFHQPFDNAHDAYCDIKATADCFWMLFDGGFLDLVDFPYLMDAQTTALKIKYYSNKAEYTFRKSESKKWNTIFDEARETLGFRAFDMIFRDGKYEKVLNYIRRKYHIRDDNALSELLADDEKRKKEAKIKSFDEPIALFKKAAKLGDAYSMYRLGQIYYYDISDYNSAIKWYIKAIEYGYVDMDCYFEYARVSTRLYGNQSIDGPKYYAIWSQMCEEGFDTISRRHLDLYIEAFEWGCYGQQKIDIQKAIDICERALSRNEPEFGSTTHRLGVRYKLAQLYERIKDYKSAVEQYVIYLPELKTANIILYYQIEEKLISYYFEGDGIEIDYAKAKQYIDDILSYDPSDSFALYYLGQYYEHGLNGCQRDDFKAFECYEKAAKDLPEAMRKIGIMFLYGRGCEKNKKQARAYLTQAKNKGIDVSPYLKKAKSWF